ncbi:hypothetical protein JNUCC1_00508 [Lentibacillus sp. JNUCC-1]|uniref:hypothetical protein n=1 Tax=Lentibacillus sp. JNUCC-1 TaxID=2654513 RepID=UPI0012E8A74A|nr:hypothetical protein [Lentibacillus sp. JNUCC-1]MUV36704.1 hypothetical protein [Lentibacillus sp. JNUCC-1]
MPIRIGAIGPADSVQRVMEVGQQYTDVDIKPFVYQATEDTGIIIERNRHLVDQWFFSGPVPYDFAVQNDFINPDEGIYATLHGSSLLGVLLTASMERQQLIPSISLDSIDESQLRSVKPGTDINHLKIHQYPGTGYVPKDKLVAFHEALYRANETTVAITCINGVYHQLQARNIPVYRVIPSELAVQLAIDYLRQRQQKLSYRKKQLVIIGFEVIYPSAIEDGFIPYKIQHSELELHHQLLQFTEKVNGSLAKIGNGKYVVYTTRGELEFYRRTHSLETFVEDIKRHSSLGVRVGIGYGHTVLEADEHVHIAFDYARQDNRHNLIIVNEDKEVSELRGSSESTLLQQRIVREKFEGLEVSATQAMRVFTLAQHHEKQTFTAQELAGWLQGTERNARRVLQALERAGFVRVVGEESGQRGRPRRVYQLEEKAFEWTVDKGDFKQRDH